MKRYFLGIDTSCYTTSCAIIDDELNIVGEARKILDVKPGMKGLQQSNMVFQHTKVLPRLIEELPQVPLRVLVLVLFLDALMILICRPFLLVMVLLDH